MDFNDTWMQYAHILHVLEMQHTSFALIFFLLRNGNYLSASWGQRSIHGMSSWHFFPVPCSTRSTCTGFILWSVFVSSEFAQMIMGFTMVAFISLLNNLMCNLVIFPSLQLMVL
jgi:hypothetical protein